VNPSLSNAPNSDSDGVYIYDKLASEALIESIRLEKDVHTDILVDIASNRTVNFDESISTDVNIELWQSTIPREMIPRENNRVVLINSNRVFHFCSSSDNSTVSRTYKDNLSHKSFDQKTMLAFIIVLSKI
jgi:hypothetical protein